MSDLPLPADVSARVGGLVGDLAGWLAGLDPAYLQTPPAEGEWTVAEIVAHVTDFLTHWPDVAVAVAAQPGRPFGRNFEERDRYVLEHRTDALGHLLSSLRHAGDYAQAQLASIPAAGWEATGVHARWGELAVSEIVRKVITDHLADHVGQARTIYAQVTGAGDPA